ncbi:MAG: acyl-CoA dehydrogenase [Deltaproteobacteria bacterium]|nr:acyl-CoA dehydrogenase [Deltaproteobacteria bacterium]
MAESSEQISEEVELLEKTLTRFVREDVLPLERTHGLDWDTPPPKDLRRQVRRRSRELGLYAIDMPVEVGGAGLPFEVRCRLEMTAHSLDTLFFEDLLGGNGGPTSMLLACNQEQRRRFLAPLVAGDVTTCFALSEAEAGSDVAALRTRAERRGDRYVLDGVKNIISNAAQADFAMVFAVTDPGAGARGVTCFLVPADTPGFRVSRTHDCVGFKGYQAEISFEGCEVPAANVLGGEGQGLRLAMDWINGNRVRTSAWMAGVTRHLLERSSHYAGQRRQFGAPIGSFQAIQIKLADMATELFAAEQMILRSAWLRDHGQDLRREASMTKLFCSEMVNRAAWEAMQIHGGAGCLRETGLERIYRMARVFTVVEGTSEIQRVSIARSLLAHAAA